MLIEQNLQYLFHNVLVVYAPEEKQIQRMIARDGTNRDEAVARLKAQLPIEDKSGYADFIVNNGDSLEETRKQVDEIRQKILEKQEEHNKVY